MITHKSTQHAHRHVHTHFGNDTHLAVQLYHNKELVNKPFWDIIVKTLNNFPLTAHTLTH